jgi:hypothetical protein
MGKISHAVLLKPAPFGTCTFIVSGNLTWWIDRHYSLIRATGVRSGGSGAGVFSRRNGTFNEVAT